MVPILKSHTVIIHIQIIIHIHSHKSHTSTINIDIAIYNLQHTVLALCISSLVVHISSTYIYNKSFNNRYIIASSRRERPRTTLGGLLPSCPDMLGALALIGPLGHHHCLLLSLLLRHLSGLLLLPPGLLLLPSSIDILSQCLVVLRCLLKFFLG
jgi:hypothetical protein